MDTHTPLPWRIRGNDIVGSDSIRTDGNHCESWSDLVCTMWGFMGHAGPRANAELIVHRVNTYPALVAALKHAEAHLAVNGPMENATVKYVQTVLANALLTARTQGAGQKGGQ